MSETAQQTITTTSPPPAAHPARNVKPQVLLVEDLNCHPIHAPKRIHDLIIDGKLESMAFEAGTPKELPVDVALRFLSDESFKITTPDGKRRITPPPKTDQAAEILLKPDEIVARYNELTDQALVLRAKQLPGGEAMNLKSGKQALIDFLMQARVSKIARPGKAGDVEEDDRGTVGYATVGGSMGKVELDKMFADTEDE